MRGRQERVRTVDDYVRGLPQPQRAIVERLRGLLKQHVPMASEVLRWGKPWYFLDGPLCYISPASRQVTFGYRFGAFMPDPGAWLVEGSKVMRHVRLRKLEDVDRPALSAWLEQAVRLDPRRSKSRSANRPRGATSARRRR